VVDYTKWDNIDLSDDDTETLPKMIDKKSFEKFQKNKRTDRDNEEATERTNLAEQIAELKDKLEQLGSAGAKTELGQKYLAEQRECEQKLYKLEKYRHWNVDNMCKTAEQRTIINSYPAEEEAEKNLDDEAYMEQYADFCEKYQKEADEFLEVIGKQPLAISELWLSQRLHLISNHGQTYMMLDCLEKEMNGKHKEMKISARQHTLVLQILELAKTIKAPVAGALQIIFERFREEEKGNDALQMFDDEVKRFIERTKARAITKKKEMDAQKKEKDGRESSDDEDEAVQMRAEDPAVQKVLDEMPKSMLKAFMKQDTQALHVAVASLPGNEGKYWMRRCEEVGLWNAGEGEEPPYRQD